MRCKRIAPPNFHVVRKSTKICAHEFAAVYTTSSIGTHYIPWASIYICIGCIAEALYSICALCLSMCMQCGVSLAAAPPPLAISHRLSSRRVHISARVIAHRIAAKHRRHSGVCVCVCALPWWLLNNCDNDDDGNWILCRNLKRQPHNNQ